MVATYITNSFRLYLAPGGDFNNAKNLTAARTFAFGPGGKIIYAGDDGDIWRMNYDGGEQRQLTNTPFKETSPCVSPDGRYIFFTSTRSGSTQVWRMNADGSNQIQLTHGEGGYPRFVTPDQRWVYFESGLNQTLWRVSPEGSDEVQVSEARVWRTAFSPDGKLAAYFFRVKEGEGRHRIAVMSLESGKVLKTFPLTDEKSTSLFIAWAADSRSFDYITVSISNSRWRQSLDNDSPRFIADLGSEGINDFALSPDGNYAGLIRGEWIFGAVLIQGLK
jgi:Tol biopolymer transport system component